MKQQIYSLPPLATWVSPLSVHGANGRIRTPDLLITNQLLYQLSYIGVYSKKRTDFLPASGEPSGIGRANVEVKAVGPNASGHGFSRGRCGC